MSVAEFTLSRRHTSDRRSHVRWVLSYALRYWWLVLIMFIGAVGNAALSAYVPVLTGDAFNAMLKLPPETVSDFRGRVLAGDRSVMPGLVRASFGCYNTTAEIDTLVEWLQRIRRGHYQGRYIFQPDTGSYVPLGWDPAPVAAAFDL